MNITFESCFKKVVLVHIWDQHNVVKTGNDHQQEDEHEK